MKSELSNDERMKRYFQMQRDPRLIDDGIKKQARITLACSPELKEFLNDLSVFLGVGMSDLDHKYVVEGMRNEVMFLSCPRPHLDQNVCELLKAAIKKRHQG